MDYQLIGSVCCVAALAVLLVILEIRRGRRHIIARLDAHAEALRMLARLVQVELPPEPQPPKKPDLHIVKDTAVFFAVTTSALVGWGGRHTRVLAGTAVALALGILLLLAHGAVPVHRPATQTPPWPATKTGLALPAPSSISSTRLALPGSSAPLPTTAGLLAFVPVEGPVVQAPSPSRPRPSSTGTAVPPSPSPARTRTRPSPTGPCLVSAEAKVLSVELGLCI